MSKRKITAIGIIAGFGMLFLIFFMMAVMYRNADVRLRNAIKMKQKDNVSEFDNMAKKINQVAQVPSEQMKKLKEIFIEHAQARGGVGNSGIMAWLKESVPNVDVQVYANLQNIIVGSRDRWTMRQKELLDFKREHDNLIEVFPSCFFLSLMGRTNPVEVAIVTSAKAEEAFKSGQDNDVELFKD